MTTDDIVRMALAGKQNLKDRIAYAIALEREECAKIAFNAKTYLEATAAIRARGSNG